jgi:hypothetical protein
LPTLASAECRATLGGVDKFQHEQPGAITR